VNLVRNVVAVILGYAVFAVSAVLLFRIAGRDAYAAQSPGFTILAVIYGIVFAGVGGLVAARIGPTKSTAPAGFVALIIALGATVSLVANPGSGQGGHNGLHSC
jgi:hypothetical protein